MLGYTKLARWAVALGVLYALNGCVKSNDFITESTSEISDSQFRIFDDNTAPVADVKWLNDVAARAEGTLSEGRFDLVYFDTLGRERSQSFNFDALEAAFRRVGFSELEARNRAEKMFMSVSCSPDWLAETAKTLAPILGAHTQGYYVGELRKPYVAPSVGERPGKRNPAFPPAYLQTGGIKAVNVLAGVSGNVAARGSNFIEVWTDADGDGKMPFDVSYLTPAEVQTLFNREGEHWNLNTASFERMVLGQTTEQQTWQVFNGVLLPYVKRKEGWDTEGAPRALVRLKLKYNYLMPRNGEWQIGYTIYDIDGLEKGADWQ